MRKILGILVILALVFSFNLGMAEELKPAVPSEEEKFFQKLEQDMVLSSTLINLISDIMKVEDALLKLEAFQANPVISEKVNKDWTPVLRKYRQVLGEVYLELKKMLSRSDFIPWDKVRTDLNKYYPEKLVSDISRVFTEMNEVGL